MLTINKKFRFSARIACESRIEEKLTELEIIADKRHYYAEYGDHIVGTAYYEGIAEEGTLDKLIDYLKNDGDFHTMTL